MLLVIVIPMDARPSREEFHYVVETLGSIHPEIISKNEERRAKFALRAKQSRPDEPLDDIKSDSTIAEETPITDAIVSTMLSQNTTDANQHKAFATLKKEFPSWNQVANESDSSRIEDAIRVAGLAKTRADRLQNMLQTIQNERHVANFEYLRYFGSPEEIQRELSRFKGMGPKTISCVLLFALGIPDSPVDTHVLRITQQMKWVPKSFSREAAYNYLNQIIPEEMKLDLHCLLVTHGKQCHKCAANGRPQFPPKDGERWECPLTVLKSGKFSTTLLKSCNKVPDSVAFMPRIISSKQGEENKVLVKTEKSGVESGRVSLNVTEMEDTPRLCHINIKREYDE
mmetsp:Transcript_30573/g.64440  ORF Transcript_30573/g.64440 Transcript_30573/m.64440 type:complete len:342 (-) Transcript_30573:6-1031(-)